MELETMSLFHKIVLLLLALLIASWATACADSTRIQAGENFYIAPWSTHVYVYDELEDSNVTIHCKSKDDDLGTHVITPGENYEWKFRVNFMKSTLFFCGVSSGVGSGVFDLYIAKRDLDRCERDCIWRVKKDGVFGYNDRKVVDVVYRWSQPQSRSQSMGVDDKDVTQ